MRGSQLLMVLGLVAVGCSVGCAAPASPQGVPAAAPVSPAPTAEAAPRSSTSSGDTSSGDTSSGDTSPRDVALPPPVPARCLTATDVTATRDTSSVPTVFLPGSALAAYPCGLPERIAQPDWPRELCPVTATEPAMFVPGSTSIALLPDTQYYAICRYDHLPRQAQWLADQAAARNLIAVIGLGDITDENTEAEWDFVERSLAPLTNAVPTFLASGNHDHGQHGTADQRGSLLRQRLPHPFPRAKPLLAESLAPGDVENAYYRFRLGKADVGVLVLEWSPRTKTVAWAKGVFARYPKDRVIFVTHAYLYFDGTRYDAAAKGQTQAWNPRAYATALSADGKTPHPDGAYDGEMLWQELLQHHPGLFLTLNGHVLGAGAAQLTSTGLHGNTVQQVLVNYQMLREGGRGFLRLMEFLPDGKTLRMKTYSPSLQVFATAQNQNFDLQIDPPLW